MLSWIDQLSDDQIALLACGGIFAASLFSMFLSVPLRNLFSRNEQQTMGRIIPGQLPDAPTSRADYQPMSREKAA
ncbi:MAG: hypothetical protein ACKVT0_14885 [Planctomycetaceae bacterium]